MADKRRVKKSIKQLQYVKTWQLLIILIILSLLTATFLRLNNIGMIERRAAVISADKSGNEKDIQNSLYALQRYSAAHVNASSGVIYLEATYNKDVKHIVTSAERASSKEYQKEHAAADAYCQSQFSSWSPAYVQCYADQLKKHGSGAINAATSGALKRLPSPSLYRHEFESPLWSPDFAGWSLLASVVVLLMIVVRLVSLGILRLLVKRHYKSI